MNQDTVTEIVKETAVSGRGGKIDLRELQTGLFHQQRSRRRSNVARVMARSARRRYQSLPPEPKVADCKVEATTVDKAGKKYFTLTNGQRVHADWVKGKLAEVAA